MAAYAAAYARALADVVVSSRLDAASVDGQLQDFADTFRGSSELREILSSPSFNLDRRLAILDSLNAKMNLGREVRNFIAVLMRNGRLHAFNEVLAEYRREMDKRCGISEALITTARKLDETERRAMEAQASAIAGNKIRATFHEDSALVGGVVLRIGSTVYDGSVRGRLQKLKEQLILG
jgi:F-type H+-transporting ATPase subunit delta